MARVAAPPTERETKAERLAALAKNTVVHSTKEQEDFEEAAYSLAESLGWKGDAHWEIGGITVKDARRVIQKTLHEVHQAALNDRPLELAGYIEHLGLDQEQAAQFSNAVQELYGAERSSD